MQAEHFMDRSYRAVGPRPGHPLVPPTAPASPAAADAVLAWELALIAPPPPPPEFNDDLAQREVLQLLGSDNDVGAQRCVTARRLMHGLHGRVASANSGLASAAETWVANAAVASAAAACASRPVVLHASELRAALGLFAVQGPAAAPTAADAAVPRGSPRHVDGWVQAAHAAGILRCAGPQETPAAAGPDAEDMRRLLCAGGELDHHWIPHDSSVVLCAAPAKRRQLARVFVYAALVAPQWVASVDVAADKLASAVLAFAAESREAAAAADVVAEEEAAAAVVEALVIQCAAVGGGGFAAVNPAVHAALLQRLCGSARIGAIFTEATARVFDAVFSAVVLAPHRLVAPAPPMESPLSAPQLGVQGLAALVHDTVFLTLLPRIVSQFGFEWIFASWSAEVAGLLRSNSNSNSRGDATAAGASVISLSPVALTARYEVMMVSLLGELTWKYTFSERLLAVLPPSIRCFVARTSHSGRAGEGSGGWLHDNRMHSDAARLLPHFAMDVAPATPHKAIAEAVSGLVEVLRNGSPSPRDVEDQLMLAVDADRYVLAVRSGHSPRLAALEAEHALDQQTAAALRGAIRARFAAGVLLTAIVAASIQGGVTVCTLLRELLRRTGGLLEAYFTTAGGIAASMLDALGVFHEDDIPRSHGSGGAGSSLVAHVLAMLMPRGSDAADGGGGGGTAMSVARRVLWELADLQLSVERPRSASGGEGDRGAPPPMVTTSLLRANDWGECIAFVANELRGTSCAFDSVPWLRALVRKVLENTDDGLVAVAEAVAPSPIPTELLLDASQVARRLVAVVAAAAAAAAPRSLSAAESPGEVVAFESELRRKYSWLLGAATTSFALRSSTGAGASLRQLPVDARRCVTQQQIADRAAFVAALAPLV